MLVLPSIRYEPLRAKSSGPYTIDKKISDVDYIVCAPDRRKTKRMCHVNMLKGCHVRDDTKPVLSQNTLSSDTCDKSENPGDDFVMNCDGCDLRLENADISLRCLTFGQVSSVCILIVTMYLMVVVVMLTTHVLNVPLALWNPLRVPYVMRSFK